MKRKYCELHVSRKATSDPNFSEMGSLVVYNPDGKHLGVENSYSVLLATLGEEGWELVSFSETQDVINTSLRYIFRLPMEEYNKLITK